MKTLKMKVVLGCIVILFFTTLLILSSWGLSRVLGASSLRFFNSSAFISEIYSETKLYTGVINETFCTANNTLYSYKISILDSNTIKLLCSPEEKYWCCTTTGCDEIIVSSADYYSCNPFAVIGNSSEYVFQIGELIYVFTTNGVAAYLVSPPPEQPRTGIIIVAICSISFLTVSLLSLLFYFILKKERNQQSTLSEHLTETF